MRQHIAKSAGWIKDNPASFTINTIYTIAYIGIAWFFTWIMGIWFWIFIGGIVTLIGLFIGLTLLKEKAEDEKMKRKMYV